ncbi:SDR family oxidoreductase [Streptacidiphilus melanogenes]|uniref:SDR family oxidoreductase n=1 Tax=Streptacidiphilus melanogenes TaxID=411235 RepID=UPI0005A883F2|nr:SDR family oxidoreductase [Streptacidiphilus melanogenes]
MDNASTTALVTGANKGIGKEIARQLAASGVRVLLGARDAGRGREAVAELNAEGEGTGDVRLLVLDVTDPSGVAKAAAEVERLDILVNNAGMMAEGSTAPDADLDAFRRTFETNLFGVLTVTNAFLPALRRSPAPRIVNISSGTGSLAWSADPAREFALAAGSGAAYRSSKTALNALTLFYAQTLAPEGFKVNALAPGLRRTDLNERAAASDGDPAEAAAGAVRLALLPEDGPTGAFLSWDGTPVPW